MYALIIALLLAPANLVACNEPGCSGELTVGRVACDNPGCEDLTIESVACNDPGCNREHQRIATNGDEGGGDMVVEQLACEPNDPGCDGLVIG